MAIEDLITADLDWRENEMVNLKLITLSTEIDTPQRGGYAKSYVGPFICPL